MRRPPPLTSPHPGSGVYAPSEMARGGGEVGAHDGGRSRDARFFSPSSPGVAPPVVRLAPRFPAAEGPGVSFQRMLDGPGVSETRPGPGVPLTPPASGLWVEGFDFRVQV